MVANISGHLVLEGFSKFSILPILSAFCFLSLWLMFGLHGICHFLSGIRKWTSLF